VVGGQVEGEHAPGRYHKNSQAETRLRSAELPYIW
jgi:hypothetical protein